MDAAVITTSVVSILIMAATIVISIMVTTAVTSTMVTTIVTSTIADISVVECSITTRSRGIGAIRTTHILTTHTSSTSWIRTTVTRTWRMDDRATHPPVDLNRGRDLARWVVRVDGTAAAAMAGYQARTAPECAPA